MRGSRRRSAWISATTSEGVYVGEVRHKGEIYAGAQNAIVDRALWDQVQQGLADKAPARQRRANIQHPSLLAGLVYDGHGRPMTPSHAVKLAKRYRYYMTRNVETGGPAAWRVPAHDLEKLVIARLCRHFAERPAITSDASIGQHDDECEHAEGCAAHLVSAPELEQAELIAAMVARIDVHRDRLDLWLDAEGDRTPMVLTTSAALVRSGRQTRLLPPGRQPSDSALPDEGLVRLVANAHAARKAIGISTDRPISDIASDHGFTVHYFSQLSRLGSLAPDIVSAILEGRQPAALTRPRLARTKALPVEWNEQRRMFGFA